MFVVILLARVLSIPKKLLHIARNNIKKRIMTIGLKTKKLFKVKKCPINSKNVVVIFLASVFFIPKKFLHTERKEIRKEP